MSAGQDSFPPPPPGVSLRDYVARVLARNESVQVRLLEFETSRSRYRAERGAFEPEFFSSATRESNSRQNTVEQQRNTLSEEFSENNNIYQSGIESLVPTGAKVRLGATLRDLRNNLQDQPVFTSRGATNGEYQTFVGASLTQPLLKGAGANSTLAALRIAGVGSKIAFQEYRRQLMLIMATAEASYWNVYMAQEQVRFFQESVQTAQTLLDDNRARLKAGKGTDLEVLEAEAGLALRQSKLSEARQKQREAINRAMALYSEASLKEDAALLATDPPPLTPTDALVRLTEDVIFLKNPDYLIQTHKLEQEGLRVDYAVNQRLPELDLKASYGLNGLGETPGDSLDAVSSQDWPSWSVGAELRVPLGGGAKTRNELRAARLRQEQARLGLRELYVQVTSGLNTSRQKIETAVHTVASSASQVRFNEELLKSALDRLEVGKLESRRVLEIEADLLESRNAYVDALVQLQRAQIELLLLEGSLLERREMDLTQQELQEATAILGQGSTAVHQQLVEVARRRQRVTP